MFIDNKNSNQLKSFRPIWSTLLASSEMPSRSIIRFLHRYLINHLLLTRHDRRHAVSRLLCTDCNEICCPKIDCIILDCIVDAHWNKFFVSYSHLWRNKTSEFFFCDLGKIHCSYQSKWMICFGFSLTVIIPHFFVTINNNNQMRLTVQLRTIILSKTGKWNILRNTSVDRWCFPSTFVTGV